MVSVTTETACSLYPTSDWLRIRVGALTAGSVEPFLGQYRIRAIVDASHPFAIAISELAIATAQRQHVPYLRYERPSLIQDTELQNTDTKAEIAAESSTQIIRVKDYSDLFNRNILDQRRVLLVLGYRPLPLFKTWQTSATLFARILPSPIALETALDAGFTAQRLIALRPPIEPALEKALWQQWKINLVVAKASGHAGGEVTKRQLATQLGIPLVLIQRPALKAPAQTQSLVQVIQFCQDWI